MTPDSWTILRQILYPVMGIGAATLAIAFALRYRSSRCSGDLWTARLAGSIAVWTISGTVGLWIGRISGYSALTSAIFTLGIIQLSAVIVWGTWRTFRGAWRHSTPQKQQ